VQEKLDVVKTVMQENIQQILLNQEQVDKINSSAEHLAEQSLAFKSTTKELRNKMFWKMVKMRLLIGAVIVCVLIVIIVPVVVMVKAKDNAT
jgi:UDP-glucose 6-dehydrogenase